MYKMALTTLGTLLLAQQGLAMEEFYTAPGARAMAMGGAFTAVAEDSSTVWYNPGGLGFLSGMDVTLDYGTVVVGSEDVGSASGSDIALYDTESELKYLGFSGKGFGMAYFRPYDFHSYGKDDKGDITRIRTEYSELKFGFGVDLNDHVAVGGSIDMISQSTDSDCESCDENDETGFGYTLGVLGKWKMDAARKTELRAGATWRSGTDVDALLGEFEDLPNRPQVLSLGLAVKRPFDLGAGWGVSATGSVQFDDIAYSKVLYLGQDGIERSDNRIAVDHERIAYGAEFQFITPSNQSFFIRAGGYDSEAEGDAAPLLDGSNDRFRPYSSGVEAVTAGLGVYLGDWIVDYAMEQRTILKSDYAAVQDQDETLHSLSISRAF